jgi:homogentisate phytyltransferase/homogentisate geranylgeranyltransferase
MYLRTLWQFSRPHTIIGTTISVISLQILALASSSPSVGEICQNLGITWLACILANIAIVGLNQIFDVPIDRINKPQLPLPAGEMTLAEAWLVVSICSVVSLAIATSSGVYLSLTVALSLCIGACYSLPPIRLKQYAFWSAFCIVAVRGLVVNIGLFLHFTGGQMPTNLVWLLTIFMLGYGVVIALCKDLVDVKGDRQFGIATFSVVWGKELIFQRSQQLLMALFLTAGLLSFPMVSASPLGLVLMSCAPWISMAGNQVNVESTQELSKFYRFIWRLFYLAYLCFPLGLFRLSQIISLG